MVDVISVETLKSKIEEIERNNSNQKVCIVGVVGRFHLFQEGSALNQLLNTDVFKGSKSNLKEVNIPGISGKQVEIRLFYDEEQKTVFLQLNSVYDYSHLMKTCRSLHQNLSMAGRHHYWQGQLLNHASALLFMFSVAHIVVVTFPTPRFDLTYLRLFKVLASARYNMLHSLSQSLASLESIPEIWRTTGRPCIPRIIFSFQIPWKSAKHLNESSLRKLQESLQDQVHLILKKNRLLGSLSSSSLFTVSSPNQLFVHVQSPARAHVNPVEFCINYILRNSVNLDAVCSSKKKSSNASIVSQPSPVKTTVSPTGPPLTAATQQQATINGNSDYSLRNRNNGGNNSGNTIVKDVSLRDFLYKQIDYMMTVESREMPAEGRRGTHVEAPDICLWYRVCSKVFEYFLGPTSDNNSHLKALAQALDLDWKFSENRCHKVTPIATNAYLESLPSHYTQSFHLGQLSHSLRVFTMNARGPAFEHYAQQLQEECNQVWWNGRHLCEASSMTGQPCVYPYHGLPEGKHELDDQDIATPSASASSTDLPSTQAILSSAQGAIIKSHSSRVTTLAACNCGRTQGTREDPFDLKNANYEFYQDLEKKCCSYLLHMTFPRYPADHPMLKVDKVTTLQKGADTTRQITILGRQSKSSLASQSQSQSQHGGDISNKSPSSQQQQQQQQQQQPKDDSGTNSQLTALAPHHFNHYSASSLSYTGTGATGPSQAEGVNYVSEFEGMVHGTKSLSIKGNDGDNQSSATTRELFEGMFTTALPPDILPTFPSWSLIILGSSSLYQPAKGVEQVGYFAGSNFLLLWDIPVDVTACNDAVEQNPPPPPVIQSQEELWPAPGEIVKPKAPLPPAPSTHHNHHHQGQHPTHLPLLQTMNKVQNQVDEISSIASHNKVVGKTKRPNSKESTSVKAYIGHEYECPRGHRFFCSAPDKMVKASSGNVRENASKLVTGPMPLYFPCPCRSSKPLHLAQLTRTYAVTPDCHVAISVNPRVQPGDSETTPIFYTGIKDGIILPPSSYCVLRYPYVYVDENGPILPPAPSQPLLTCKLLKGVFSYSYVNSNEDTF